jgi:hypothetical protein
MVGLQDSWCCASSGLMIATRAGHCGALWGIVGRTAETDAMSLADVEALQAPPL